MFRVRVRVARGIRLQQQRWRPSCIHQYTYTYYHPDPPPHHSLTLHAPFLRRRMLSGNAAAARTTTVVVHPTTGEIQHSSTSSNNTTTRTRTRTYQLIIGLEIHAQLDVTTKLFSPAAATATTISQQHGFRSPPANHQIHPFDVAVPGTYPVLHRAAVRAAVLAAAALQCTTIAPVSRFERKHYVYADLPHGYQITQQRWPLARDGRVVIDATTTTTTKQKQQHPSAPTTTRIERIQLEIDTAKTLQGYRIDANRAGCPLLEIVTAPDLRSAADAARAVTTIRSLLQHTRSCDGRMERGHFRVDCNINIVAKRDTARRDTTSTTTAEDEDVPVSSRTITPRVEVKNLNSVAQVQDAIQYEARRQTMAVEAGQVLYAETRTWNNALHQTERMRRKEQADDYRFLPEPDLPPLHLNAATLGSPDLDTFLRDNLPELPAAIRERYQALGLPPAVAHQLSQDPHAVQFFDAALPYCAAAAAGRNKNNKVLANLICNEITALVASDTMEDCKLTAQQVGTVVDMLDRHVISKTMAKRLLEVLYTMTTDSSSSPSAAADPVQVAQQHGFQLVTDTEPLQELCRTVIAQHPEELSVYQRGGKFVGKMEKLFTGKAMQASQGNAHPERLGEILRECLQQAAADAQKK